VTPEIRHLLGGYATGTLTDAERARLFAAALEDQELFDALAEEQQWKDLLDDPESRGYLLAELDQLQESKQREAAVFAAAAPMMRSSKAAAGPVTPAAPPRPPARFWLPFAAVMMALVVTGWFWWAHEPPPAQQVAVSTPPPAGPAATPPVVQPAVAQPVTGTAPPAKTDVARAPARRVGEPLKQMGAPAAGGPKPAEVRQDLAASSADEVKKERDVRAEPSEAKSVSESAAPAPAPAPPPATALARAAYQVLRLENGQFVPRPATTRFQAGDRIVILLPSDPPPQLTLADGSPVTLERDGDGFRSAPIDLRAGTQEFLLSRETGAVRSRFAAGRQATAKSAAGEVQRIRLTVE
jgi:hypothetical protein